MFLGASFRCLPVRLSYSFSVSLSVFPLVRQFVRHGSCGLVGLPNVGKSTIFNCLVQRAAAESANFPFCTINPQTASVGARDPLLNELASVEGSQTVIPTQISFTDIAGLIRGASQGAGLGNQFLSNVRSVAVILHVVRCFDSGDIIHVENRINPIADLATIETELLLSDLQIVEKRIENMKKKEKNEVNGKLTKLLDRIALMLNAGIPVRMAAWTEDEAAIIEQMQLGLITQKPQLILCNVDESASSQKLLGQVLDHLAALQAKTAQQWEAELRSACQPSQAALAKEVKLQPADQRAVPICAQLESEIVTEVDEASREEYYAMSGLKRGLDQVVKECQKLLKQHWYYTIGQKEARAWAIPIGAKAPQAAGRIHSDLEKGFINAEIIKPADFIAHRGSEGCKTAGKVATQGKQYIIEQGDICNFRFNKPGPSK